MVFKQGEYLKLPNKSALHVILADEEKIFCMKMFYNKITGWAYTGECVALSNKDEHYAGIPLGVQVVHDIEVSGKCVYKPLQPEIRFPMV